MLFGITITPLMMLGTGLVLLGIVIFQYLEGKRIIHFKGRLHQKVHRVAALVLLTGALFHAAMGVARVAAIGLN
jgi:succinate dehydrogenase hydrophobic anchor subunit